MPSNFKQEESASLNCNVASGDQQGNDLVNWGPKHQKRLKENFETKNQVAPFWNEQLESEHQLPDYNSEEQFL